MKLAISNIAWQPSENDAILEILKKLGVTGLEVAPSLLFNSPLAASPDDIQRVRGYWNENGVQIVAMQALLFGKPELQIFTDEATRRATLDYLSGVIMLAGKLGGGPLVFGSPKNRRVGTLSLEEVWQIAVPFFRTLGEVAQKHQQVFCIEANAPQYDCDFVTNTEEALALLRAIDHPGVAFNLDAGVMTLNGENYADSIEKALPYLRHFHISEPFLSKISQQHTDHNKIARTLRKWSYEHWISIEMRSGQADSNPRVVEECLKVAADIYLS